ncbi:flagellar basal body L-ring protein FlgH [Pelagicoccus albus]|uniref:Flagellar basal body L-ring protein FlgH n=1 Tax=Pelagicoccus albus TaxID=415222 RepID=A0A7X1B5H2_9BACT|nr:flagellar basal body L-ring protein FlgH [Pelagicoccus albus]MBC2606031.1 flagellar basal body L-ring protein FlgH [Pelagicoccus albus]
MCKQLITTAALLLATALSGKSLWDSPKNNESGMFADRSGAQVGDIITLEIEEETIVNRTSSKSSSTSSNISQDLGSIVIGNVIETGSAAGSISLNPNDSFNGSGTVADTNIFQARVAVMVVDVQPNGNLIVEGARKVKSSGEAQYLVVRGIVRKDDVLSDNTVTSENVLNASIEMFSEGDLKTAQTKGWIQRLVDVTNVL